jgi:hypothetical protein
LTLLPPKFSKNSVSLEAETHSQSFFLFFVFCVKKNHGFKMKNKNKKLVSFFKKIPTLTLLSKFSLSPCCWRGASALATTAVATTASRGFRCDDDKRYTPRCSCTRRLVVGSAPVPERHRLPTDSAAPFSLGADWPASARR